MGEMIQLVALVVLVASLAYVLLLIFGNFRIQNATVVSAEAESQFFRTQIAEIMDRRQIIKAQDETSWQGFRKFKVERKFPGGLLLLLPGWAQQMAPHSPLHNGWVHVGLGSS